ncbi:MAG: NAD(P)/FAD-dependent oxidoreductase [Clostridia bacterium]|nr:NAD(P)/FAD-dependent oxidoreductase [Clostridia bacterium]
MKIAVVGGGASGICAAISAARQGADVTIFERCDRIGRKILATGNGRCNYTNINAGIKNYHGKNAGFVKNTIENFWVDDVMLFFEEIGMLTKVEDKGKAYPYSLQASAVLDVLRFELEKLKVKIVTNFEVKKIEKKNNSFLIKSYDGKNADADRVILSAGGKASPSLGSNGSGYDIAKNLGLKTTELYPSLVQVKTDTGFVKALKGIKIDAAVSAVIDNKTVGKSFGEVLFCDYGLSGPAVFDISRICSINKNVKIKLDLLPEIDYNSLRDILTDRKSHQISLENYFIGMMNKKIGIVLMKYANILPLSRESDTLDKKEIARLCEAIKSFTLNVTGTMSWNNAQVTAGGIDTDQIDSKTFECKKIKGLYITGELLDIDGDCGGFNLQWAWSSGYIAGLNAASEMKNA